MGTLASIGLSFIGFCVVVWACVVGMYLLALWWRWILAALLILVAWVYFAQPANAADRSRALRAEFQRQQPCPSTGKHRGPCPGYQVDHREALICGGRDELGNLQWLALAEHREKTKVEVKLCRARYK